MKSSLHIPQREKSVATSVPGETRTGARAPLVSPADETKLGNSRQPNQVQNAECGVQNPLPDSDLIVLAFIKGGMAEDDGLPMWPAYHDGDCWRNGKDGDVVQGKVIGWMEIHEAHQVLTEYLATKTHKEHKGKLE